MCGVLRDLVTCAQFKKRKNTHGGVLLLVKLQTEACNFTKSNTPPWVFFTSFKLYEWYQEPNRATHHMSIEVLICYFYYPFVTGKQPSSIFVKKTVFF